MTYLELVNKVLTRLREDTVATVGQNSYSSLIGEFVNDAKSLVENAWDWSAYYRTVTFITTTNDYTYTITNSGQYTTIESALNDTQNTFMQYRDRNWFEDTLYNGGSTTGAPMYWGNDGVDTNGDLKLRVFPKPDGVYTLNFNIFRREDELSSDTNTVSIPWQPIMHLAVALASRERGETGGTSAQELFAIADQHLADAIAIDANRAPEKLLYRAV
jgi:hypothetical protein